MRHACPPVQTAPIIAGYRTGLNAASVPPGPAWTAPRRQAFRGGNPLNRILKKFSL